MCIDPSPALVHVPAASPPFSFPSPPLPRRPPTHSPTRCYCCYCYYPTLLVLHTSAVFLLLCHAGCRHLVTNMPLLLLSLASFSWRCLVCCCISSRPPRLPGLTEGASCLGHPLSLTRDVTRSSSSSSSRPRLEQGEVPVRLVTHRCFLAFSASR